MLDEASGTAFSGWHFYVPALLRNNNAAGTFASAGGWNFGSILIAVLEPKTAFRLEP